MFIGFCKQGLCMPFTRPHHLLLTAGIDSKYPSRQHYICIILLVEFSKNLLHAIRPQAHKDPLRRLENWLYSRNNTTELSKQLPPSLGGGLESQSVKFCFFGFSQLPFKGIWCSYYNNFGESFTALCPADISDAFQPKAGWTPQDVTL